MNALYCGELLPNRRLELARRERIAMGHSFSAPRSSGAIR